MSSDKDSALHEHTREIYEAQHERIAGDDTTFNRIIGLYAKQSFGIDPAWFKGKRALDAGCGNNGAVIIRLVELGCQSVAACDIGEAWMPLLRTHLAEKGVPAARVEMRAGNVLDLPYETGEFDFVSINGVLLHLNDMAEIERGFAEGARVTKPEGYYFTSFGPSGGLMQGHIMPAARAHYRTDEHFRHLIDNITPALIHGVIDKICSDSEKHGGPKLDPVFLKSLFGEDFCVFLQNFIQAPQWWSNQCTPEYVEGLYRRNGFAEMVRLNEFVKRTDIRKYFAPLHYDRDNPLSKALYGHGYVKYTGRKVDHPSASTQFQEQS